MGDIIVESAFNEIEYRKIRLKEKIPALAEKRIVIYGTGVNTGRVLEWLNGLNILGLMDSKYTGRYMYGKKVLSEEEIRLLGVDTILIAAEPYSAQIVYLRIVSFCMKHHITILDMYGCDEIQLHQNILRQKLSYAKLSENEIKNRISSCKALIVSFKNVLCSEIICDEEKFYKKFEEKLEQEKMAVHNFARKRIMAQKRALFEGEASRKEIFDLLTRMLDLSEKDIKKIRKIEEELYIENLRPRYGVIELLQYAIGIGTDIYIYSDIPEGEKVIGGFQQKYGIAQCNRILAEDKCYLTGLLGRTVRALAEKFGPASVLFIGNEKSDNLIIPQLYDIDFQIIQSSYDMFFNTTALQINREWFENSLDAEKLKNDILQIYDTPFFDEAKCNELDGRIAGKMGCFEVSKAYVELFPVNRWNSADKIQRLVFQEEKEPLVSIIIPAYNHFEYTYNCLESILMNTDSVPYEVIVADDCSDDMTSNIEKLVEGISVIHNRENLVFIKNCNNAAGRARGKYIVFLNNDTQVQLNWLYPLVKCLELHEDAGMVGSKLVNPDGSLLEAGCIVWNNANGWNYGGGENPDSFEYNYVREVDYISGACIMISKKLWNDIGGFDERYVPAYYEDVDLAFEVRKRGKKVLYQPDSVVVHFESVSNGKNPNEGIKKYQLINQSRFLEKWEHELKEEQYPEGENVLGACERKQGRRTVLFISEHIPTYDRDAGSRTLDFYIQEFIRRGYLVKFIPNDLIGKEPYTHRLEQMGVEVLRGKFRQNAVADWIYANYKMLDYVFLSYPHAAMGYIDLFNVYGIPVMYYGVDLHYLRLQREYELTESKSAAEESKIYYEKEAYLIKNADVVYYPSQVEVEIVKREFHRDDAKQLMINIYDMERITNDYNPGEREGIMFIGGYQHMPNVDAVLWFSHKIFSKVYEKLEICFYIAGADMPADISNIKMEGAKVLGALTDAELEEMYRSVKMIVVPLRYGAGIKGKVIEAMYHGIPVVTTSIGIEGIPNDENAVKIANGEEDFADAVIELYQSENELERMSKAGQEIIRRYYSREAAWNNIAADFR